MNASPRCQANPVKLTVMLLASERVTVATARARMTGQGFDTGGAMNELRLWLGLFVTLLIFWGLMNWLI